MDPKIFKLESEVMQAYNYFDRNFYEGHILPVRNFSTILAKWLESNSLICDSAALLHDIGITLYGVNEHNISGSKEAERLLMGVGFDNNDVRLIARVIKNHNGAYLPELTLEDEILRSADGMAHISEMSYTFQSYLLGNSYVEAKRKTKEKILFEMEQKITIPLAKEMIYKKYELAINLLNEGVR